MNSAKTALSRELVSYAISSTNARKFFSDMVYLFISFTGFSSRCLRATCCNRLDGPTTCWTSRLTRDLGRTTRAYFRVNNCISAQQRWKPCVWSTLTRAILQHCFWHLLGKITNQECCPVLPGLCSRRSPPSLVWLWSRRNPIKIKVRWSIFFFVFFFLFRFFSLLLDATVKTKPTQ